MVDASGFEMFRCSDGTVAVILMSSTAQAYHVHES